MYIEGKLRKFGNSLGILISKKETERKGILQLGKIYRFEIKGEVVSSIIPLDLKTEETKTQIEASPTGSVSTFSTGKKDFRDHMNYNYTFRFSATC